MPLKVFLIVRNLFVFFGVLDCCIDYVVWTLAVLIIRRIRNHGRAVGDDNLGPTWNS